MSIRLLAIYAGGTIGMAPDRHGALVSCSLQELLSELPFASRVELGKLGLAQVDWKTTPELIDSANVGVDDWRIMAGLIADNYEDYQGFVLLHGTDSMAYSASALSFALHGLSKPVVFTGAQFPLGAPGGDGLDNLMLALRAAAMGASLPEVCIAFGDRLLRGNRARKAHTNARKGFDTPNHPALGLGDEGKFGGAPTGPNTPFECRPVFSTDLANLFYTPGMRILGFIDQLNSSKANGLLLHSLGCGNMPTHPQLFAAIKNAVTKGKTLLNITQCAQGSVDPSIYSTGRALRQNGVIQGGDMTPEAAATKLMWALANIAPEDRATYLTTNQAGELTA